MNLLLSIYTKTAHEEVLLPSVNNADFSVRLSAEKFSLRKDLKLELEVLDNRWRLKNTGRYTAQKEGQDWLGKDITNGDILTVSYEKMPFTIIVLPQSERIGSFEKYDTAGLRELTVGKEEGNDICYSVREVISRRHLTVYVDFNGATVVDQSANGVYVNGRRIYDRAALQFGDVISVFGLKIVYLEDTLAINAGQCRAEVSERLCRYRIQPTIDRENVVPAMQEQTQDTLFHRSPRKMYFLHTEPEEIEGPPQKQVGNRKPVWMVIGPSFTMAIPMLLGCGFMAMARNASGMGGGAFMYVGLVTAIASAIIGVAWALINLNYSKKEEKETELLRIQKYGEYLMACAERIREKYEHNRGVMQEMYPDARTCCEHWRNPQNLWNRNRSHQDFMSYRVGLGDIPFQTPITIPKSRFTLQQDDMLQRPSEIKRTYETLMQVPITVDLQKHRVVGIVGQDRADIARSLVTQIAANNCYTDVRLAIIGDGSTGQDWSFMKWLPHTWNAERSQRYVALSGSEVGGVAYELAQIFRARSDEQGNGRHTVPSVQYVVLVESCELLESEALAKYLYDQPETIGVSTLLLAKRLEDLPNSCNFILESNHNFAGIYSMQPDGEPPRTVNFDRVSIRAAEKFARKISGVRVVENGSGSDLTDSLTFLQMLSVNSVQDLNVLDNWRKNRTYQTMQAMVGWKAGGAPCYLNIHEKYHGPHGLIAGTTGSGKSETLQTYILSLAINYSPMDVGFFIIDFKGGGMANLFQGLPHILGTISNLSGNQVRRAMVSIKSENMRRQRIFNEYGINHIDAYTKLVKSGEASVPVPHLFIIIDEFAELKREQPEFMRELISVAQVGRSLGVHLILATQKPSGTVDDNIWSNTKFRLCLRVADKQDSKDMLHKPDAAFLTQAGRCYLQVGNDEIYELFQSGWSGAVYDEETGSAKANFAQQLENNGKIAMTGGSTRARKMAEKKRQWIRQLLICGQNTGNDEKQALNRMFESLAEHGIDYPDSTYNRRQMADFLELQKAFAGLELDDQVEKIFFASEKLGRKLPELKDKTQLDAIVEHLAEMAKDSGFACNLKLWMPVLPEKLLLSDLQGKGEPILSDEQWEKPPVKTTLRATVGLVDDPQNQSQFPMVLDFLRDGHLAICGATSSGKSVLMQTIAYALVRSHTPDMLNLYVIDYSSQMLSPFENLPHTGGVVYEGETDKLGKLFLLMRRIIQQRKRMFRGGSFLQYITANGNTVPAVVLMLDGYASFREKTENAYENALIELARDGAGLGVFLCISAGGFGTGELQNKIGDKLRQVVCLEMDSKYSYGECLRTMQFDVLPETGVRGRGLGLFADSVLEYQVAVAYDGDDYERGERLRTYAADIDRLWKGKRALPIPEIPKEPQWQLFTQLAEYAELIHSDRYLPVGYRREDASVYAIDLSKTYCYQICGRERSGKTVFLRNVACAAKDKGGKIYLVDKIGQNTEQRTAELVGAEYVNTPEGLFELWKNLILQINDRHIMQKELSQQGLEDNEIFEKMAEYPHIYVLIADLPDFINACVNPGSGRASMGPQADNIIQRGALHNVFFFGAVDSQDLASVSLQSIYRSFVRGKQGVHLGGELNSQKLLSYRNIPYAEQSRSLKPGVGFVPDEEDSMNVDTIVIPMNKGQLTVREEQG